MPARDVPAGDQPPRDPRPQGCAGCQECPRGWGGTLLRGGGDGEAEPPVPRCSVSWLSCWRWSPCLLGSNFGGGRCPEPACSLGTNGCSRSKTCHKREFPLLLKKVPALPGNLSREGDVSHTGGKFFVWLRHPWELGEVIAACRSRHQFALFTPHPSRSRRHFPVSAPHPSAEEKAI